MCLGLLETLRAVRMRLDEGEVGHQQKSGRTS